MKAAFRVKQCLSGFNPLQVSAGIKFNFSGSVTFHCCSKFIRLIRPLNSTQSSAPIEVERVKKVRAWD